MATLIGWSSITKKEWLAAKRRHRRQLARVTKATGLSEKQLRDADAEFWRGVAKSITKSGK